MRLDSVRGQWKQQLQQLLNQGRQIIPWGAGSKAVSFCSTVGLKEEISYAIDINPYKQGKFLPGSGHRVEGPEYLRVKPPQCVVIMNPIYESEISKTLREHGIEAEILLLC